MLQTLTQLNTHRVFSVKSRFTPPTINLKRSESILYQEIIRLLWFGRWMHRLGHGRIVRSMDALFVA